MREFLTTSDMANAAMMLRSGSDVTVVVVEGITDRRLYGKFLDRDGTETLIAHSKDKVRTTVNTVYNDRKMDSIVGFVDADLDHLKGKVHRPPLFATDTRDSESMMLRSDSYDDIITEYGDPQKVEDFTNAHGDIRDAVLDACYPIGIAMLISQNNGFGLSFKDLDFESFIDRRTLRCDVKRMISEILGNSNPRCDPKRLYDLITNERPHDRWAVCRGHDLMSVLAMGLKYIFGGSNCRYLFGDQLGGSFRLSFGERSLMSTDLYKDSERWCSDKGLPLWDVRD